MILEGKLGLTNQVELAKIEGRLSKQKAKELYGCGKADGIETGMSKGLSEIHEFLFSDVYGSAEKTRSVNTAKRSSRLTSIICLERSLQYIGQMPQTPFKEITRKYMGMNIVHPSRGGNGRSTRIWLDLILGEELQRVVDWSLIDKADYPFAIERSPIDDLEIRYLVSNALVDKINDRELYVRGIDVSYFCEKYSEYTIDDL